MELNQEKFDELKEGMETFYKNINCIHCPYFNTTVNFNHLGWEHIFSQSWNRARPVSDQFSRLRLIKTIPEVLKISRTLQGIRKVARFERIKRYGKWQVVMKNVTYYEFIAVVELHNSLARIRIIIKEIEGGEKFFLSVIPFWKVSKTTGERILGAETIEDII